MLEFIAKYLNFNFASTYSNALVVYQSNASIAAQTQQPLTLIINSLDDFLNNVVYANNNTVKPYNIINDQPTAPSLLEVYMLFNRVLLEEKKKNEFLFNKNIYKFEGEVVQSLNHDFPYSVNSKVDIVLDTFRVAINNLEITVEDLKNLDQYMKMGFNHSLTSHFFALFDISTNGYTKDLESIANNTFSYIRNKSTICSFDDVESVYSNQDINYYTKLYFNNFIRSSCINTLYEVALQNISLTKSGDVHNNYLEYIKSSKPVLKKYITALFTVKTNFEKATLENKCEHLREVCNYAKKGRLCLADNSIMSLIEENQLDECIHFFEDSSILDSSLSYFSNTMQTKNIASYFYKEVVIRCTKNTFEYARNAIEIYITGYLASSPINKPTKYALMFVLFISKNISPSFISAAGKYLAECAKFMFSKEQDGRFDIENIIQAEKYINKHKHCSIQSTCDPDEDVYSSFYNHYIGEQSNLCCKLELE